MKNIICLLTASMFSLCAGVWAADIGMELLPRGRPFRLTFADPREIRMALGFQGDDRIDAVVGNYFSLFAIRPVELDPGQTPWMVHFGLEGAGYFTMHKAESRFPLQTADGLIGLYTEGSRGPWQFQMRYTHISAHLADGSQGQAPIAYSRESWISRVAYLFAENMEVYGGLHLLMHSIPTLPPLTYQAGGSAFFPIRSAKISPFAGIDLQWGPAMPYSPSFNLQLGVALNNPPEAYRSFRFFYDYFTGTDPRGQFYNRAYTSHSFGIEMQI